MGLGMIYRIDTFQIDEEEVRLTRAGEDVVLEPKAFRLLNYFLKNPGRLLRKQELLDAVWQDTAVGENALTRVIALVRKALDDNSREPRFIETVPTVGYRFLASVETVTDGAGQSPTGSKAEIGMESSAALGHAAAGPAVAAGPAEDGERPSGPATRSETEATRSLLNRRRFLSIGVSGILKFPGLVA